MSLPPVQTVHLRAAAVWGTTVLSVGNLAPGESYRVGEGQGAKVARPDGLMVADLPIRAVGGGWELDARGATGGKVSLRGRDENPADLARNGAPIPIVAGDYGLVQYQNFSIFFQFTDSPPRLKKRRWVDWSIVFAFVFAAVAVLGGLALIWAITTPQGPDKPLELVSNAELAAKFKMKSEDLETPPVQGEKDKDKGKGIKDPGAKDKKDMGGGKKMKGAEGQLGKQGKENETKLKGEIRNGLGGMAEALSSDIGEEVKDTLGTISSVADALGGLRSDQIVLGAGTGTGLRGTGPAGGGTGEGVPFGSGTLDTGWGPGRGGGYGSGSGGPGGRGVGGRGLGGSGEGEGQGSGGGGEKKVAGVEGSKAGQGLTPSQISRVVMSRMGAFRACYESAAAREPGLKGTVGVSFSITPGGSVASASLSGSSINNSRVEGCVLRQFRRLSFPAADKGTNASFPFLFKPG